MVKKFQVYFKLYFYVLQTHFISDLITLILLRTSFNSLILFYEGKEKGLSFSYSPIIWRYKKVWEDKTGKKKVSFFPIS